ncbi:hypothetical protein SD71_15350 [Cohnella kolymensis]|uniref:DUF4440 domain-containing protein n=1 Tax=Cohnella kolymensis TaxID=1590652 RepID=A0ABR5A1U8_9BACL|nr:nuclear transport factor 2 family protein [Cohnella kolymensis]KIL35038.1 hypothetical protein SD71_15350 [Cohnella kolymensis]
MDNIQEVLEGYFKCWNEAFISKNGDEIRNFMSKNFVGYWAHSNIDKPEQYDYNYDINNVLKQYDDAEKSFEPVSITKRKDGEDFLVVGTETNKINNIPHTAKCMFVWRRESGEWKLLREYIELEK